MRTKDIIRAWKDAAYRQSLREADRAKLPAHPAGMIEIESRSLNMKKSIAPWTLGITLLAAMPSANWNPVMGIMHHTREVVLRLLTLA